MGIRDTLFAIITFVIMVHNGVIMESRFADDRYDMNDEIIVIMIS